MEATLIGAISGLATAIAGFSGGAWLRERHARRNGGKPNEQLVVVLREIGTSFAVALRENSASFAAAAGERQRQTQLLVDQNNRLATTLAEIAGTLQALSKR